MAEIDLGKVIGPQGEKGEQGERGLQGPIGPVGPTGSVDMDTPIEFMEAETLANIESGESVSTIFGKLKKIVGSLLFGAGSTLLGNNLTAARALVSDVNGKVGVSTITAAELGYLDGVTKNIQTQFNEQNENLEDITGNESTLLQTKDGKIRIYGSDAFAVFSAEVGGYGVDIFTDGAAWYVRKTKIDDPTQSETKLLISFDI